MATATRRQFLRFAAMGGAVFGLLGMDSLRNLVFADVPVVKGISYFPPAYKELRYAILGFAEHLRKNLDGAARVEFFDSASMMRPDEQVWGLRVGTVQFMVHTSTYISQEFPILEVMELPFVCEQLFQHGDRLAMESPLWKLINNELAKCNLFMLSTGSGVIEPEYIWSGKKRIASLADLQGMRCRVVGPSATAYLKGFGVTPVRIPSEEIYLALQRGSLDLVLANINTVGGRNLYEYLRFCFRTPVTTATIALFLLKDVWDKMPPREKAAFWEAGKWYDDNQGLVGYRKLTQEEIWPLVSKAGIEVVLPTADEKSILERKSMEVQKSWMKIVGEDIGRKAIGLAMGTI